MKKTILTLASVALAATVFGQGQVELNNRVLPPDPGRGTVNSPIFGPEPSDPFLAKTGGTSTGDPAGTQTYGGARLAGTGFTAELWFAAGTGASVESLQQAQGTTTFRTGSGAGYLFLGQNATLPGVTSGRVTLQLRVWDNMGGTVTSWASAVAQGDRVAHGASALFSPAAPVGFGTVLPPPLDEMTSFNIHLVPEPSTIALGILGGIGTLILLRRRK